MKSNKILMQEDKERNKALIELKLKSKGYADYRSTFSYRNNIYYLKFNCPVNYRTTKQDILVLAYWEFKPEYRRGFLFENRDFLKNPKKDLEKLKEIITVLGISLKPKEPEKIKQPFERFIIEK